MSYARLGPAGYAYPTHHQFGFGAAQKCAANASFDVESAACMCNPGFDQPSTANAAVDPCLPVSATKPCANVTQARSPVTLQCDCPPGMAMMDPTNDNCTPANLFPGCRDAAGNPVPGCLMGVPTAGMLPGAVVGLAIGSVLAWLVFK